MKRAFNNLFRRGEANPIKILCLGVGLAIGLTMLAEVIFEQSYDNFLPRLEDTYRITARRHVASLCANTGSHRSGRETVLPRSGSRHTLHVAGKRYAPRGGRPAGSDRQRPPVRQFVLRRLPPPHPYRRKSAYGTGEREQRLHLVAPCRNAGHRHRGTHADVERISRLQAEHRRHLRGVSGKHSPAPY